MTDCRNEFPPSWFAHAKLSPSGRDCSLNFFGVDASQPLSVWRKKGWIHPDDPHGWFQWYSRYYMDRRMPDEDARQRSSAGRQSDGTSRRSSGTASRAIQRAGHVSVRLCCTGPMTVARFDETVLMLRGALRPSGVPAATGMVATAHESEAGRRCGPRLLPFFAKDRLISASVRRCTTNYSLATGYFLVASGEGWSNSSSARSNRPKCKASAGRINKFKAIEVNSPPRTTRAIGP